MERPKVFDAFNSIYERLLSGIKSRSEIFDQANDEYLNKYGFKPYKDFSSFMSARSQKKSQKKRKQ